MATKTETPRGPDDEPLCAWCGGAVRQGGVGRRRAYCGRTCREYAYRARREERVRAEAYEAGRRAAVAPAYMQGREDGVRQARQTDVGRAVSSIVSSTDEANSTVDETEFSQVRGGGGAVAPVVQPRPEDSFFAARRRAFEARRADADGG